MNNKDNDTIIGVFSVYPQKHNGCYHPSYIEGMKMLYANVTGVVHVGDEIVIDKDTRLMIESMWSTNIDEDYDEAIDLDLDEELFFDDDNNFDFNEDTYLERQEGIKSKKKQLEEKIASRNLDYVGYDFAYIFVKDTDVKIGESMDYQVIRHRFADEEIEINEGATKQKELDKSSATIGCKNCGAPMKLNQYGNRFECPFCGYTAPIEEEGNEDALIEITHIQYKRENDLISVEHLNKSELVPPYKRKNLFHENVVSINVLFGSYDGVDHFSKDLEISVACPSCGAEVIGKEHQNTFECEHCGHKIIVADSIKAGTYKKRNIVGQFGEKNVPKQAIPFEVSEDKALKYALEFIRSNDTLRDIPGLEKHVKEWLFPFFVPVEVFDASFMWKAGFPLPKTYYGEIRNCIFPDTQFLYKYQIDRLEPWNFDKIAPFDAALMDENAYIISSDGENILRWFAPELIDYRIRKAHETITGNRVELMSTAKRHFDGQKNGLILIPVYNTELLQVENQYISVAVNGQTGKVVVQIQESEKGIIDTRNLSEPMEYESEPRHWDDNPREYTRFEGPYRVEKTKDKDMVKIVKSTFSLNFQLS